MGPNTGLPQPSCIKQLPIEQTTFISEHLVHFRKRLMFTQWYNEQRMTPLKVSIEKSTVLEVQTTNNIKSTMVLLTIWRIIIQKPW